MKKSLLLFLVFATFGLSLSAQKSGDADARLQRSMQRAERMANSMKLSDADKSWFSPLFVAYQDTLRNLRNLQKPHIEKKECKLTDDEMLKQIELGFDIDEKQVQIKRAYFQKFKERLNAKQLKQVFHRAEGFNKARHPQQGQRPGMGGRGGDGFGGPGFGGGDF